MTMDALEYNRISELTREHAWKKTYANPFNSNTLAWRVYLDLHTLHCEQLARARGEALRDFPSEKDLPF